MCIGHAKSRHRCASRCVTPIGVVVTVGTSGVEQVPPGQDAVEDVWAMCLSEKDRVLFIGTRFSNLYTAVDTPAEAA